MDSAATVAFRRSIGRGWSFLLGSRGWIADAAGVAVALALLQLLLVASAGARLTGADAVREGAVRLEVERGTIDQRTQELYAGLRALPDAGDIRFVTAEQMLQDEAARDPSLAGFLQRYGIDNPFSDAFVVTPRDPALYAELRTFVQDEDARGGIAPGALAEIADRETASSSLVAVAGAATTGVGVLTALAAVVAAFLSLDLARRFAASRAHVAKAERLAGAAPALLSSPSVVAAAIVLWCALAVAVLAAAIACASLVAAFSPSPIGTWLAHAAWAGALPSAPVTLVAEVALLSVIAWVGGRARSGVPA